MVKWRNSGSIGGSLYFPLIVVISVLEFNNAQAIGPPMDVPQKPDLVVVASPSPPVVGSKRVPKQVGQVGGAIMNGKDQQQAAGYHHDHHGFTGGGGGGGGGGAGGFTGGGIGGGSGGMGMMGGDGKYFQYAHNPHPDEYEFGYRRGNDYHFQERYEKYGPAWNFKTKVKWGDKHAGYGEHYWDYNHAGHDHDGGGGGGGSGGGGSGGGGGGGGGGSGGGGGDGHYSEPVPTYQRAQSTDKRLSILAKRENQEKLRRDFNKRSKGDKSALEDSQASASQMRGNYGDRMTPQIPRPQMQRPALLLDPQSGQVIDESTGNAYWLRPATGY